MTQCSAVSGFTYTTRHDTDAFHNPVRVATVLTPHQFNLVRKILVDNRVVEHHATIGVVAIRSRTLSHTKCGVIYLVAQKTVDRVVAHIVCVIRKMRQRVVNRTYQ